MSDQVLIVAAETAARTPADVARSLSFTPIVATSEQEAIALLDEQAFTLIAVSGGTATWQRLRDVAERKQPMARVLELPDANGDAPPPPNLMLRYLPRPRSTQTFSEAPYRL